MGRTNFFRARAFDIAFIELSQFFELRAQRTSFFEPSLSRPIPNIITQKKETGPSISTHSALHWWANFFNKVWAQWLTKYWNWVMAKFR